MPNLRLTVDPDALTRFLRGLAKLTQREFQIAQLLLDGLSSKDIASRLEISERTIETYRSRVCRKTGSRSTADFVRLAAISSRRRFRQQ